MAVDTYVLPDAEHAVLVLTGVVVTGCGTDIRRALLESERHDSGHVIVDVRHVAGIDREVVNALLWELGRAFDEDRTMRLVVRDDHQEHFLNRRGVSGMIPVHTSLAAAMAAADKAEQTATRGVPSTLDLTPGEDERLADA